MARLTLAFISGLILLAIVVFQPSLIDTEAAQSQGRPAGTLHTGKAFRFNKVKDGIYHAVGTGALSVVGNSSVIVNDEDVIVVDDHVSPAAAWVLLEELKDITNKPGRPREPDLRQRRSQRAQHWCGRRSVDGPQTSAQLPPALQVRNPLPLRRSADAGGFDRRMPGCAHH